MSLRGKIENRVAHEGRFAPVAPALPQTWEGDFGLREEEYTVDARAHGGSRSSLGREMNEVFERLGIVVVANIEGPKNAEQLEQVARLVMRDLMVYEGGSNPRDAVSRNVFDVGAPLVADLPMHHEMAYVGESTSMLGFLALQVLPEGRGCTHFSNSVAVTDDLLRTELGQRLAKVGVCYHRDMTDASQFDNALELNVYNHWQKSMGTTDRDEAEAIARSKGLVVDWGPNGLMQTRYYQAAYEYFPQLDRNLIYSSIADTGHWFDTWPGVQHVPVEQRPLRMTFGDDVPFTREQMIQWARHFGDRGRKMRLSQGDVAIICNHRFAHGRPAIHIEEGEKRRVGVLLGAKYARLGQRDDKWT